VRETRRRLIAKPPGCTDQALRSPPSTGTSSGGAPGSWRRFPDEIALSVSSHSRNPLIRTPWRPPAPASSAESAPVQLFSPACVRWNVPLQRAVAFSMLPGRAIRPRRLADRRTHRRLRQAKCKVGAGIEVIAGFPGSEAACQRHPSTPHPSHPSRKIPRPEA
jgi:hypothetical protein